MADMFDEIQKEFLDRINSIDWAGLVCNWGEPILRWYSSENIEWAGWIAVTMAALWVLLLLGIKELGSILELSKWGRVHRIGLWLGEKHERLYWRLPLIGDSDHKENLAEAAKARQERLIQKTKVRW